jgi:hypothetical protein
MPATGSDGVAHEVLAQLRAQYPESPFLALGQTVFWDEPMKAVLRRQLDVAGLGGQMVLGVHDTDYFAKTHLRRQGHGRFALLPHNDGTTKALWSAAGEISTLFGSETFPSRDEFVQNGVAFEKAADAVPASRQAFLDAVTEAWGWRGLVYTGSRDLIVSRLPLKEVGDGILEMLRWGFENALVQIGPHCCQGEARLIADTILDWCQTFRASHPDKTLTDLYQHLLPKLYTLLLGHEPQNVTVDGTAHLLRLTPETAHLPRFRFVNLFLDPQTREIAVSAYNQAVAGSTIYTLDKFGAGALPFDLILPERGRGTLRVTPRVLFVETRQPVAVGLKKPIESLQELAEILTAKLGDQVTLVGKAVTLVSMLAQEFIFVFNEEGSLYVSRTRRMNDILAGHGVPLEMRPILRIRYHTWNALDVGQSTLRLPEHLAAAFGRQTITTPDFAAAWPQAVEGQHVLCRESAALRKPLDLMAFLCARDPSVPWDERRAAYEAAKQTLLAARQEAVAVQTQVQERYTRLRALKARGLAVQQEQGEHFRATKEWTPEAEARRAAFDREFHAIQEEKRAVCAEIVALKARRRHCEYSVEVKAAREVMRRTEDEAELARLNLIRNALLTIEGLPHTNHRPSAWWLPMVDASGEWFRRIVETAELYTEPLLSK